MMMMMIGGDDVMEIDYQYRYAYSKSSGVM
jgi:hypothetical protein